LSAGGGASPAAGPGAAVVLPDRTLTGHVLVAGRAAGSALVCTAPISGWGGIDPATGTITEITHPQRGASFTGRILVMPGAKGSSGWSGQFHLARVMGTAPVAVVTRSVNSKLAVGLVALQVPAVQLDDLDAFVSDGTVLPVSEVTVAGGRVHVRYSPSSGG